MRVGSSGRWSCFRPLAMYCLSTLSSCSGAELHFFKGAAVATVDSGPPLVGDPPIADASVGDGAADETDSSNADDAPSPDATGDSAPSQR